MIIRALIIISLLMFRIDSFSSALTSETVDLFHFSPVLTTLLNNITEGNMGNLKTVDQVLDALRQTISYTAPTSSDVTQIIAAIGNTYSAKANSTSINLLEYAVGLLIKGLYPNSIQLSVAALTTFNSMTNNNPYLANAIQAGDPTFSVDETVLRSSIYIPSTFAALNASKISPIIMVPGTGAPTGQTYAVGYAKKLVEDMLANPVWINIPTLTLKDAQLSAEYVVYAINYISQYAGGQNVSVIAFSQGNLNTQWALKYFPSTRNIVSDYIGISPDYHGTTTAQSPKSSSAPSILQQMYDSTFVRVLRQNGGDSEFVPTTTIYSATDEIVQPQSGPNASGILLNANNNLIQELCPLQPAGLIYTHEGILYNPLGYALTVDALTHLGHADTNRMLANNPGICLLPTIPGLTIDEVLILESTVIVFAINAFIYYPKQSMEPPIKDYATY